MKKIVIGITGSIAAYKTCELISRLKKKNYNIEVIMTKNAAQFVTPLTFGALIHKPVLLLFQQLQILLPKLLMV